MRRSRPSRHNHVRAVSDPLDLAILPPNDESAYERERRVRLESEAKKVSDSIDEQIRLDKQRLRTEKDVVKVLLLGQSESGKSTTLKQFQLLHSPNTFYQERIAWRAVIYLNLIRSVRRILEALIPAPADPTLAEDSASFLHFESSTTSASSSARPNRRFELYSRQLAPLLTLEQRLIRQLAFPDEDDDPMTSGDLTSAEYSSLPSHISMPIPYSQTKGGEFALRPTSNWKKSFSFLGGDSKDKNGNGTTNEIRGWWEDPRDPVHILHACAAGEFGIRSLWKDEEVRGVLAKRRVRMEESAGFYLNDVDRITKLRYIPTDEDVLRARLKTVGVVEHSFMVAQGGSNRESVEWRIYDVGGSRNQRQAWAPYFDDVNAIIFLAPISAFDQTLAENSRVNRLEDSMLLWRSVISNKLLSGVNIILFLNKCDLLKAKLEAGVSLAFHMVSYRDRPNDYESVTAYFVKKFASLHKSYTPNDDRDLYIHLTSVTDKLKTAMIIQSVRDLLLKQNLQYSRLL